MDTAEKFLVVILSGALAVFLILGIVVLTKVIQILNHLKSISEKAEQFADKAEAIGEFFGKTAGPVAFGKLIANVFEAMRKRKNSNKRGEEDE